MEEGYPEEELAEDREVNEKVLGDEECDAREEDLGSEGEFGLIDAAYELLGSPTSEVQYICQRVTRDSASLIDAQMSEIICEEK